MIGRRVLLAAGAGLTARERAIPVAAPAGDRIAFLLRRHGSEIGQHVVTFARQPNQMTVTITVHAEVTLLSVPIARYHHQATEIWQDATLISLVGRTDKNLQHEWVNAHRTDQGLMVSGSRTADYLAPASAIPTSYWNKRMLDGPMISLEDGVLLHPTVAPRAPEPVRLASGDTTIATRYDLRGAFDVDVWYDSQNVWTSLAFDAVDGSTVRYERL